MCDIYTYMNVYKREQCDSRHDPGRFLESGTSPSMCVIHICIYMYIHVYICINMCIYVCVYYIYIHV